MPTVFPNKIQTFTRRENAVATDGNNIKKYQEAMQDENYDLAQSYLKNINNYDKKVITANYLNTITDTLAAVENFYATKYNPTYLVSETQPASQEKGDFWFQITGEV